MYLLVVQGMTGSAEAGTRLAVLSRPMPRLLYLGGLDALVRQLDYTGLSSLLSTADVRSKFSAMLFPEVPASFLWSDAHDTGVHRSMCKYFDGTLESFHGVVGNKDLTVRM